jgi:hypothetical protein
MKYPTFSVIANKLITELKKEGIGAYIWHEATTGSVYVRFEDHRMGSVRIGNHAGRDKYQYKFNIRSDMDGKGRWLKPENTWRYFQPMQTWREIIPLIVKRAKDVQEYDGAKYQYGIPSWKRNSDNHAAKD